VNKSLLLLLLAGCGSDSPDPATPDPTSSGACSADTCDACLAIAGCNWTGDRCESECLQDVACYGPGNPASASCPAAGSEGFGSTEGLAGSWHEDQSRATGDVHVFVPTTTDLGPSRFRQQYTFSPSGEVELNVLAPDDAHYPVTGSWTRTPEGIIEITYTDTRSAAQVTRRLEVVHIVIDEELHLRSL
jgi:hypothetical protein